MRTASTPTSERDLSAVSQDPAGSSTGVSRRSLTRGIAWAAPAAVVLGAAPAMAISHAAEYVVGWSNHANYGTANINGSCVVARSTIDNLTANGGGPAGISVSYYPGKGSSTTATVRDLKVILAVPKGTFMRSYVVESNYTGWSFVSVEQKSFTDSTGSTVTGMDVYTFEHAGALSGQTSPASQPKTIPGSLMAAQGSGNGITRVACGGSSLRCYAGYTGSFTTGDGVTRSFNNITPITLHDGQQ